MKRSVGSIVAEVITMLEQVAGSEDPAMRAEEREVARGYAESINHSLERSRRAGNRLTRSEVRRYIYVGFQLYNPTLEEFHERRVREGKAFVKDTIAKLDIAERLRDEALTILERNS